MLTDMKTLLKRAEEAKCAIPAFNVYNGETALGIIRAAEEANACVILQMYSRLFMSEEAEFHLPRDSGGGAEVEGEAVLPPGPWKLRRGGMAGCAVWVHQRYA